MSLKSTLILIFVFVISASEIYANSIICTTSETGISNSCNKSKKTTCEFSANYIVPASNGLDCSAYISTMKELLGNECKAQSGGMDSSYCHQGHSPGGGTPGTVCMTTALPEIAQNIDCQAINQGQGFIMYSGKLSCGTKCSVATEGTNCK